MHILHVGDRNPVFGERTLAYFIEHTAKRKQALVNDRTLYLLRKALVLFNLSLAATKINSSDISYGYEDVSTYRVRLYKNFSKKTVCDRAAPNVFDVAVFCAVQ